MTWLALPGDNYRHMLRRFGTWRTSEERSGPAANGRFVQARGKYMIPAFKMTMYTSIGCSMYMMGRLVLVSSLLNKITGFLLIDVNRDTRPGSARTRFLEQVERYPGRLSGAEYLAVAMYKQQTPASEHVSLC